MTTQTQNQDELIGNLSNQSTWIRLVYMLVYGVILHLAGMLMWILCTVQFIFTLIFGDDNESIRGMCKNINQYIQQALAFVSYNSDDKPFPFNDKKTTDQAQPSAATPEPSAATTETAATAKPESDDDVIDGTVETATDNTTKAEKDNNDSRD